MILTSLSVLMFNVFFTRAQLPVILSPSNVTDKYSCSSVSLSSSHAEIQNAVQNQVNPYLTRRYGPLHNCGGHGWTEVVNINMSDGNTVCPAGLVTLDSPIRSCTISAPGATVTFPVTQSYARVCGRISAIQKGTPDAFGNSAGSGGSYVDGMTIRYSDGNQYYEGHIWTFTASVSQIAGLDGCPCNMDLSYELPSFLGSNYFCDSGNLLDADPSKYYLDNPLWDGEGCLPTSKCCRFNNPPWFYRELPASTTNSLKLDIYLNYRPTDEDIIITEIELYVST